MRQYRACNLRAAEDALNQKGFFADDQLHSMVAGRPVCMILRPGRTPSGIEVRRWLRRLVKRIRQHWPGHYGREEAMTWCEENGIDYIFGFAGNTVLDRLVDAEADDIRTRRAEEKLAVLRGYAETRYAAKSWSRERRVVARIEAKESDEDDMLRRGLDIRYVVTDACFVNFRSTDGSLPSLRS
jgi:hypothetical protein